MDLQGVVNQAVTDLGTYNVAAQVVVDDQKKLTSDQSDASVKATTAQTSTRAAIVALTDALAVLPAAPPLVPALAPVA